MFLKRNILNPTGMELSHLALALFTPGTYGREHTPQGNIYHKHRYELNLSPQSGGWQFCDLNTVPMECFQKPYEDMYEKNNLKTDSNQYIYRY